MLKLKNIVKNYYIGDIVVEALKGIDLEFRKSDFVSILGPSGCGKTTLLNIIGGLDRYTSGDLVINGRSTKNYGDYDWDSYRNHSIGFVFQTYNLIHHQNVLGNVELALTLSGISKIRRKKLAIEALRSVGLDDQIYKKPNQLSGGQMQRVAIARALVNNPDIILADEPTGALDTETSGQIMDILKEISKDRLIIMVTHNADIANKYSTRIIRLLDGKITSDNNPFTSNIREHNLGKKERRNTRKISEKDKTSMSFFTALALSLKNLTTKKGRTILTAFAGSIGIIGIALVLAVSNGFQTYIDKMQADTLSAYPLTISSQTTDWESLMGMHRNRVEAEEYPNEDKIFINKISEMLEDNGMNIENDLSDDYINNVIKNGLDSSLYHAIDYKYGVNFNIFKKVYYDGDLNYNQKISDRNWSQLAQSDNESDPYSFLRTQYDVLEGSLPTNKNEIVIVINSYNQISDFDLQALGLNNIGSARNSFDFDEIINQTYKLVLNDKLYTYDGEKFNTNTIPGPFTMLPEPIYSLVNEDVLELKIVGIVRPNPETEIGSINETIGYSVELTDYILENSINSEIISWMNQEENKNKDPFKGTEYIPTADKTVDEQRYEDLQELGGVKKPTEINIYPVDFQSKTLIKEYLDDYNNAKREEAITKYYQDIGKTEDTATAEEIKQAEKVGKAAGVFYTDLMGIIVSTLDTLINTISIVLIVFTSISLFVSSIMIGIITYISVLERTKEIGVLRSIGARKKDIARVFNAETILIGLIAGLIGVGVTITLSIPINIILAKLIDIKNITSLNPIHAIALILISMSLTLIAGLIPSHLAAKKDPVIALRTE